MFTIPDLLELLHVQPSSPLYNKLVSNSTVLYQFIATYVTQLMNFMDTVILQIEMFSLIFDRF